MQQIPDPPSQRSLPEWSQFEPLTVHFLSYKFFSSPTNLLRRTLLKLRLVLQHSLLQSLAQRVLFPDLLHAAPDPVDVHR